ncbi:hypothetical protein D3C85_1728050 [compost metagenome]
MVRLVPRIKPVHDVADHKRHDDCDDAGTYIHTLLHEDQCRTHQDAVKYDMGEHHGNKAVTDKDITEQQPDDRQFNWP